MLTLVPHEIDAYAKAHTTATLTDLHDRLAAETREQTTMPQMQVGVLEGRLLALLVRLVKPRLAVEVGTFTGCSALHIAEALPAGGRLITLDIDPHATGIARRYFAEAGLLDRIDLQLGPALESIAKIREPVDFAFIDADKENYSAYWDALVPKVRPGGLIVADNVLWSGKVLDPQSASDHAIVAFNLKVREDPRVEHAMLTVRDGMTVAWKRG